LISSALKHSDSVVSETVGTRPTGEICFDSTNFGPYSLVPELDYFKGILQV